MTEPGVLPVLGVTLSHEPPEADAENDVTPGGSAIAIFCDAGIVPPENRKDNDEGVAVSGG